MLRITVHDSPRTLTFQLEGRLAGPWLRELEECWQNALADPTDWNLTVRRICHYVTGHAKVWMTDSTSAPLPSLISKFACASPMQSRRCRAYVGSCEQG